MDLIQAGKSAEEIVKDLNQIKIISSFENLYSMIHIYTLNNFLNSKYHLFIGNSFHNKDIFLGVDCSGNIIGIASAEKNVEKNMVDFLDRTHEMRINENYY